MNGEERQRDTNRSRRFVLGALPVVALTAAACASSQSPEEVRKKAGPPPEAATPDAAIDVLMAGNAFEAYGLQLPAGERILALPTAAALLRLAPGLFATGMAVPADQAMPLYIRDKVAQTTAEREAARVQGAR